MKRIILLLTILIGGISLIHAYDGYLQHLSPEQFRQKQKEFITEKAGLTAQEAEKFFPLYFELQDKKKDMNDQAWKLLHPGKNKNLTEAEYEKNMLKVYDLRIESAQLEKTYFTKFKSILSAQKIYEVQKAETRFHRELVKEARGRGDGPPKKNSH